MTPPPRPTRALGGVLTPHSRALPTRALTRALALTLTALTLATPVPTHAQTITPIGDGGTTGITLQNQRVHPLTTHLGPPDDPGLELTLPRYGTGTWLAQCVNGHDATHPALTLTLDRAPAPITVPPMHFPDGPPALWIATTPTGRATLEATLRTAHPGATLRHLTPTEVPTSFAALRFAPLILISAADYTTLAPAPRAALRDATAAGVTLIIATGEAAGEPDALADLAPITLGPVNRPTGALAHHLPLATSTRTLTPGEGATPLLTADGHPLILEAPHGLGLIRVIAIPFADLAPGQLTTLALTPPKDPLTHALRWLDQAPPPSAATTAILAPHTWALLALLLALALLARRHPRPALLLAIPWWITALAIPPQLTTTRLDTARILYLPLRDGALAIATLDLTLTRGGPRTLPTGTPRVALEDARPGGACLIAHPTAAAWILDGPPAAPRRLTLFALIDQAPEGADKIGTLPDWPEGHLAGATLRRVTRPHALPIDLQPTHLDAMRVEPRAPTPTQPAALPSPNSPQPG